MASFNEIWSKIIFNRYRRKRSKVEASIFDSALSHTRRSDASEKREENSVSTFGRFRLYRLSEVQLLGANCFQPRRTVLGAERLILP